MLLCLWMRGLWGRCLLGESPWVLHNWSSKAKPEVMDPFISWEVETRKFPRTWMYEYTLLSLEWSGYNAGKSRIDDNHPQATIFSLALVFLFNWIWVVVTSCKMVSLGPSVIHFLFKLWNSLSLRSLYLFIFEYYFLFLIRKLSSSLFDGDQRVKGAENSVYNWKRLFCNYIIIRCFNLIIGI